MTTAAACRVWPASVAGDLERRAEEAQRQGLRERLLAADARLWPAPALTGRRLGWLRLPEKMRGELEAMHSLAAEARAEDVRDVVVLGMGGSSLAAEMFSTLLGDGPGHPRVSVLDSTHPATVAACRRAFPPETSLYLVASKSGSTLETDALFRTFWELAESRGGGERFAAITDAGSPLAALARERGFRRLFTAPEDVGGRFSALAHFGLVPATLLGADPTGLLDGAASMLAEPDAAIELGLLLGEAARGGRDKVTLVADEPLEAFVPWLEQLLAESTGKDGVGLVPVYGEPQGAHPGGDRLFVRLSLEGRQGDSDWPREALERAGHPTVELVWADRECVGAEMMRWEIATAVAAAVLEVQPFDQPDVDLSKRLTRGVIARGAGSLDGDPPQVGADDAEGLQEAISHWLEGAAAGDYIALQAFLPPAPEVRDTIHTLRTHLSTAGLPTTLGFGPRFLHSTGQLHKGGPSGVFCLQLVDGGGDDDVAVPGADYGFRHLIEAQALGDARALVERGRRVLRVRLGG